MPLIPVTPHTPIDDRRHRTLLQSSIDGIARADLIDEKERHGFSDICGQDYRQLLLRILVDIDGQKLKVQTCRVVPSDDPWHLAYLAFFGDLPIDPSPMNRWNDLPAGLTYQDVAELFGVETEIGAAGLAALVRRPRRRASGGRTDAGQAQRLLACRD
jgi:hypothetical protein